MVHSRQKLIKVIDKEARHFGMERNPIKTKYMKMQTEKGNVQKCLKFERVSSFDYLGTIMGLPVKIKV